MPSPLGKQNLPGSNVSPFAGQRAAGCASAGAFVPTGLLAVAITSCSFRAPRCPWITR